MRQVVARGVVGHGIVVRPLLAGEEGRRCLPEVRDARLLRRAVVVDRESLIYARLQVDKRAGAVRDLGALESGRNLGVHLLSR